MISYHGCYSWVADLKVRITQMEKWAFEAMPKCFWLPGLTYPTGKTCY